MPGCNAFTKSEIRLACAPERGQSLRGNEMRIWIPALAVLAVVYVWDRNYNNGRLWDGLDSMRQSIVHNMFP